MVTLVVVESPGKIKKLQSYLGDSYKVLASYGHIRALDKNKLDEMISNKFTAIYKLKDDPRTKKAIAELRSTYNKCNDILIAADLDREGEQIAESIANILKVKNAKRIVFTEITKSAIQNAVNNPRGIDYNMVHSQETRSLLDLIVGFRLSPLLWQSIGPQLSAGRVQSVVVRLVIDRENEINKFSNESYFKIDGIFSPKLKTVMHETKTPTKDPFKGQIASIVDEKIIDQLFNKFKLSTFTVHAIFDKIGSRTPSPPFITSTLQQEAGRKFGFTSKTTMDIAQKLYESGLITYMRTDSVNLSNECIIDAKKYIISKYGKEYHCEKQYANKAKNAQEAHEAIRPTSISVDKIDGDPAGQKLYSLIWKRTIASQMAAAKIKTTVMQIDVQHNKQLMNQYFETKIENIVFDGFLAVYNINDIEEDDSASPTEQIKIPPIGTKMDPIEITAIQDYTRAHGRYNETSLNKKMEELGIGRPSTYASIMDKIQKKNYVVFKDLPGEKKQVKIISMKKLDVITRTTKEILVGKEKKKMVPTETGIRVNEYLMKNFPDIMDYQFTAKMEDELDEIANNTKNWYNILKDYYDHLNPIVEKLKMKDNSLGTLIGNHPTTKLPIYVGDSKFGPVVKMIDKNKKNNKYGQIKDPDTIENMTLDRAIELLKYPYILGTYDEKPIQVNKGKFGMYLTYDNKNYTFDKENDLTLDEAIEIIDANLLGEYNGKYIELQKGKFGHYLTYDNKKYTCNETTTLEEAIKIIEEKDKNLFSKGKKTYEVKNGQYGPYIMTEHNKKKIFVKIPKEIDSNQITLEQIEDLVKNHITNPPKPYIKKPAKKPLNKK